MIKKLREWWQGMTGEEETPFDGDAAAWMISMGVHLVVIVGLALIFLVVPENQITLFVTTDPVDEEEIEEPPIEEVYFSETEMEEIGAMSENGVAMAEAMAPVFSEEMVVATETPVPTDFATVNLEINDTVSMGPNVNATAVVKGAVGVGTTGASGAVDRITYEILQSMEQRPTLVVWLFDASPSMRLQREEINNRFQKIYKELGVLKDRKNKTFEKYEKGSKPLLTSIMSFGGPRPAGVPIANMNLEGSANFDEITTSVKDIKDDESGVEMIFSAVKYAGERHLKYRQQGRNVMMVVVSDEKGDDWKMIEDTLGVVRRYEMPVYVIGIPAPFGREHAPVKYVMKGDPDYDDATYWIPVEQGPESHAPEVIKLAFWGDKKVKNGIDPNLLDSGFGPFHLTRLCYETGGIYFAVHNGKGAEARSKGQAGAKYTGDFQARIDKFFDPVIMRAYAPDYVTNQEYVQLLSTNKARAALNRSAGIAWTESLENPDTVFPFEDAGQFKTMLDESQKAAARLEPRILQMYEQLKIGESDRAKLTRPRWQAGYDLAMGRVLAAKVRTEGYNNMLAALKRGEFKFKNEKNDTWTLVHSDEILTGSKMAKEAEKATEYLKRVVEQHKGTPWAYLAELELKTPLGWNVEESYTGVQAKKAMAGAGNGNAANPTDKVNKIMRKKAPRPKRI